MADTVRQDFACKQGDSWSRTFVFYRVVNGVRAPLDVSGDTFLFKLSAFAGDPSGPLATLDVQPGDATNKLIVTLDKSLSSALVARDYWAELQRDLANGERKTPVEGTFSLTPQGTT